MAFFHEEEVNIGDMRIEACRDTVAVQLSLRGGRLTGQGSLREMLLGMSRGTASWTAAVFLGTASTFCSGDEMIIRHEVGRDIAAVQLSLRGERLRGWGSIVDIYILYGMVHMTYTSKLDKWDFAKRDTSISGTLCRGKKKYRHAF